MLLFYTLPQALEHLKYRIEKLEKKILETKSEYKKKEIEDIIEWYFERGLSLIQYTKNKEIKPQLINWFLNRTENNPEKKETQDKIKTYQQNLKE